MRWLLRISTASLVAVLILLPVVTSICLTHCEQTATMAGMEQGTAAMGACHGAMAMTDHSITRQMGDVPATCGRDHLSAPAIVHGTVQVALDHPAAWLVHTVAPRALIARVRAIAPPAFSPPLSPPADSRLIPLRL